MPRLGQARRAGHRRQEDLSCKLHHTPRRPREREREGRPAPAPWPKCWYDNNAYAIADSSLKLQTCCRALVRAAAEYVFPLSEQSFHVIEMTLGDGYIKLQDGRCFAPRKLVKGSTLVAIMTTERAATGVWLRQRRGLCRRRVPLPLKLRHLCAMAGVAFLHVSGGWTSSTDIWRLCIALGDAGCVPGSLTFASLVWQGTSGGPRPPAPPGQIHGNCFLSHFWTGHACNGTSGRTIWPDPPPTARQMRSFVCATPLGGARAGVMPAGGTMDLRTPCRISKNVALGSGG